MALKSLPVTEARDQLSKVLDDAESGKGTMIIRNSKETAAVVPAYLARLLPLVHSIISELGESLEMSDDAEILEAFERANADVGPENITWYEV